MQTEFQNYNRDVLSEVTENSGIGDDEVSISSETHDHELNQASSNLPAPGNVANTKRTKLTGRQLQMICKLKSEQSNYYKKYLEDGLQNYIPKTLLAESISEDLKLKALSNDSIDAVGLPVQLFKDTVLSVSHGNKDCLLSVSGANMNELRLFPVHSISKPLFERRGVKTASVDGFTLPLGLFSPIRQLCLAGYCEYFSSSQILARTNRDIILLKTTSLPQKSVFPFWNFLIYLRHNKYDYK